MYVEGQQHVSTLLSLLLQLRLESPVHMHPFRQRVGFGGFGQHASSTIAVAPVHIYVDVLFVTAMVGSVLPEGSPPG